MSANTKKQCVTCMKNGGILTCDGCQQIFCGKHVIEHRQELGGQLDGIMQEHDLIQHEIEGITTDHPLLNKVNQWEIDSIKTIRRTAETARKNLQQMLDQSKEKVSQACRDMSVELCSSREADDYSEKDFTRWTEQLKELRSEIKSPSSVKIIEDQKSVIHLITFLSINDSKNNESTNKKQIPLPTSISSLKIQDRFLDTIGSITLKNEGDLAKHTGKVSDYAFIRGNLLYSRGCHMIRFRIEKSKQPYHIFFGCISSQMVLKVDALQSAHTVGWFGYNQVYENGCCNSNSKKNGYKSNGIQTDDVLHLIFDCDKKQVKLVQERMKKTSTISVSLKKVPLPWQFLMVMFHKEDCVRILPNL